MRRLVKSIATALFAAVAALASLPAAALTLDVAPDVKVDMTVPAGLCALDRNGQPGERQAYSQMEALQSGVNKVLAFFAECSAVEAARQGRPAMLQRWVIVLAQLQGGQIKRVDSSRKEFIESVGKALSSPEMAAAGEKAVADKVREAFKDNVSVGVQRSLGELARDANGLYIGWVTLNRVGGREMQVAAVSGLTLIRSHSLSVNLYRPYSQPLDFEGLVEEGKAMTADLVKLNGSGDSGRSYFDWGKIATNALVGGLVGALVVGVVALWRRFRRPKAPLG